MPSAARTEAAACSSRRAMSPAATARSEQSQLSSRCRTQRRHPGSSMAPAGAVQQTIIMARDGEHQQAAAAAAVPASAAVGLRLSPLRWLTAGSATANNMLLFRTLNRELQQPNTNEDTLAPLLRDQLLPPLRRWWLNRVPGAWASLRRGLEHKRFGVPGVSNFVDARTKWFDAAVQGAIAAGIKQVVVVAAGYDTRAYRFGASHPGVRFVEVDMPHMSSKKQALVAELLQPVAQYPRPSYVPADLSAVSLDAALLLHGGAFDPPAPTLFTIEGLIYYLPEAAVARLLGSVLALAAPGSRVAFDFLQQEVLDGSVPPPPAWKVTAASVAHKGEPFVSGISNSAEAVAAFMDGISKNAAASAAAVALLPGAEPAPAAGTDAAELGGGSAAAAAATGAPASADEAAGAPASADEAAVLTPPVPAAAEPERRAKSFKLLEFLSPRDMVAAQLPHLQWSDELPPILSFYSFAAFEVV